MIDKERDKEFRKAFYFLKRYIKSPLHVSYTWGYSAGNADKEPAQKAYDYVLHLQKDTSTSFEEKLDILYYFLEKEYKEYVQHKRSSGRYFDYMQYIKISKKQIENCEPVQTRRK